MSGPREARPPRRRKWLPAAVVLGALLVVAGVAAQALGVRIFVVPSEAMAPTIQAGQRVVVVSTFEIERGSIYIYQTEDIPFRIGRVVAIGGDRLTVEDGRVIVNGEPLTEPYVSWGERGAGRGELLEVAVPTDQVFIMGDNRPRARDSRRDGPWPASALTYRVVKIGLP